jgi:peptidyl-prolyl cis-trans isomerase C
MLSFLRTGPAVLLFVLACQAVPGQEPIAAPKKAPAPTPTPTAAPETTSVPPAANAVAATVNNQTIPEIAVYRALMPVPADVRDKARREVVSVLVENALIDQYLERLKVTVEPKDVATRLKEIQTESTKKDPKGFENMLRSMLLTEADLRLQITNELRFEKFVNQQATDKVLRGFFEGNKVMFDGTMMRARHILLTPPAGDAKAAEEARTRLTALKKQLEEKAAQAAAKLGPQADNLAREKERIKAIDEAFAELAAKESACPSKKDGGNLGWFTRVGAGALIEPFARAAFALKPYQISDVVTTESGVHLILAVDLKPGKEVKFEEVRDFAKDVYAERLHDAIVARMRPEARIVLNPPPAAKK